MTQGKHFFIFFPEVIKDFESVHPLLEQNSAISLISLTKNSPLKTPKITMFANSLIEIKWTLLQIGILLEKGLTPSCIVITIADLNEVRSYLLEQARLNNIELDLHQGQPLLCYAGVSFFNQLREVYNSGMGVHELKTLLGNRSIPWKNDEQLKALLDFGLYYSCLKNYFDGKRPVDVWQLNFKRLSLCKKAVFFRFPPGLSPGPL